MQGHSMSSALHHHSHPHQSQQYEQRPARAGSSSSTSASVPSSLPARPVPLSVSSRQSASTLPAKRYNNWTPNSDSRRGPAASTAQRRPSASSTVHARNGHRQPSHVDDGDEEARNLKLKAYSDEVYSVQEESLRNDLSQAYLNTGRRPQNFLQGVDLDERFSEYPKLAKLIDLHSQLVAAHAHPPIYHTVDLSPSSSSSFELTSLLPTKFDCILIDPPLEEYARTYPSRFSSIAKNRPAYWSWDAIASLPIPSIACNPGFIWLWVGSGRSDQKGVNGLEKGREILAKWGYRRCEDIVWLKTNKTRPGLKNEPPTDTLLTHTKEHCLMGIRGTVRRSTDSHFVHCNVDTDVIVWEGDEDDPLRKPPEMYNIIENFCLGTRRLELFGTGKNLRPGWLTVGLDAAPAIPRDDKANGHLEVAMPAQPYHKEVFDAYFLQEAQTQGAKLVPTTEDIDALRPRSPPNAGNKGGASSGLPMVPGMKSNPQGIGRHTNRSATPSASQQLELEKLQEGFRTGQAGQPSSSRGSGMRMGELRENSPVHPQGQIQGGVHANIMQQQYTQQQQQHMLAEQQRQQQQLQMQQMQEAMMMQQMMMSNSPQYMQQQQMMAMMGQGGYPSQMDMTNQYIPQQMGMGGMSGMGFYANQQDPSMMMNGDMSGMMGFNGAMSSNQQQNQHFQQQQQQHHQYGNMNMGYTNNQMSGGFYGQGQFF